MDQPQPSYVVPPPQFVMMPVAQRNGLGVFAFFVALVGLFIPTGIVAVLGLVLALAAIGRSPRGFATSGVILGLLGTAFWFSFMILTVIVGLIATLVMAVVGFGAFVLTQPEVVEVTGDMVNVAIAVEDYKQDNDALPMELASLTIGMAATIDPWGETYRLIPADAEPGFDVVSSGPDRSFDTGDDVRFSRLDRVWEEAFASFDDKMSEFFERLERVDGFQFACTDVESTLEHVVDDQPHSHDEYEEAARQQLEAEESR